MEEGLLEKTGKSLQEWIAIVRKENIKKHAQILKFLKSEHNFTHGYANFVALKSLQSDAASFDPDDLLALQYSKGKQNLKLIYDLLIQEVSKFGGDVEIVPKKSNVSVRRKKQFALIQPSTKTRIDLGLKLKGRENTNRLEDSGLFGSMCTHRVRLTESVQIDTELVNWLQEAYEAAG